jgi:hypothetical protein
MRYELTFGNTVIPEKDWSNYLTDWEVALGKQKIQNGENPAELKEIFGNILAITLIKNGNGIN